MEQKRKQIALLGSTGSIGTQALEVIAQHNTLFEVYALTAHNNAELLINQALRFKPDIVAIANETKYEIVKRALNHLPIKVYAGAQAIAQLVQADPIDIVLTAMVGYAGLLPTIKAIEAGKTIALANKETLVVAGELINQLIERHNTPILPVDSEHSAIFQCLAGESRNPIHKIILTASGGPFRKYTPEQMLKITTEAALQHPNWNMGAKITIDSATMMNKGFEVIEAKWLFGLTPQQIEVVVHPQSIVHSMVEFEDGSVKAQLGLPDMRVPIAYALSYPNRLASDSRHLTLNDYSQLTFEAPDINRFPHLQFAFEAMKQGGNRACVLNAANEILVDAFLQEEIGYSAMASIMEKCMTRVSHIVHPTYNDYVATDLESRAITKELITNI